MLRHKHLTAFAVLVFTLAECVLGVLVQTLSGRSVVWVSFACVLLACAFLALFFERTPRYALTQLALICTVFADYFLVVRGAEQQFLAMLFFSVTQLSYFARLYVEDECATCKRVHVYARIAACIIALLLTLIVLGKGADKVALISMFYFANLLLNIVFAFIRFRVQPLFAVGLALFALCDVFVGLSLIEGYLPVTEGSFLYRLAHPGFNLAWVFYVPSQTLLALSLLPIQIKKDT